MHILKTENWWARFANMSHEPPKVWYGKVIAWVVRPDGSIDALVHDGYDEIQFASEELVANVSVIGYEESVEKPEFKGWIVEYHSEFESRPPVPPYVKVVDVAGRKSS